MSVTSDTPAEPAGLAGVHSCEPACVRCGRSRIPEERVRPMWSGRRRRAGYATNLALLMAVVVLAGCATDPPGSRSNGSVITVVAAENFWGSLAEQLGGAHVRVTSIINSPDADPHAYEPNAADGRAIAAARLAIVNGVGYDPWAMKLVQASPSTARK